MLRKMHLLPKDQLIELSHVVASMRYRTVLQDEFDAVSLEMTQLDPLATSEENFKLQYTTLQIKKNLLDELRRSLVNTLKAIQTLHNQE